MELVTKNGKTYANRVAARGAIVGGHTLLLNYSVAELEAFVADAKAKGNDRVTCSTSLRASGVKGRGEDAYVNVLDREAMFAGEVGLSSDKAPAKV